MICSASELRRDNGATKIAAAVAYLQANWTDLLVRKKP
jgi:hypothetical protein